MNKAGELFENAINHWRDSKGIGTALIPAPLNDKVIVLGVLQRIYARSPTCKTVIIVSNFSVRQDIIEFLTNQEKEEENNKEFKQLFDKGYIKVFTLNFIDNYNPKQYPLLCITYRIIQIIPSLISLLSKCKFKLVVINKLLDSASDMIELYKLSPLLSDFKQNEIEGIRLSTPVEEFQHPIVIDKDSEDYKLLQYYNEYIATSLNIFGSFDIMQQANKGNIALNISSNQICYNIALDNGWNEHLDMSVEFNIEIDRIYNPMNIKERASTTYEIIRNRSSLLSSYDGKLESILDIINNNKDKKILIINKHADFASKVTDYINNMSETNICMNYHDKVELIPAVDKEGKPILYKSGQKKDKPKMLAAKAQKTYAISEFNNNKINVLSTNNAPDKDLSVDIDVIIITSPMCEEINSYIYRLTKVNFRSGNILLHTLYCKDTQEERQLEHKTLSKNHKIQANDSDKIISDFIVGD